MNKKCRKLLLSVMIGLLIVSMIPMISFANAAEPPSLVMLVNNPPKDLSIVLISNPDQPEASVRKVAWEGYYSFYSRDMQDFDDYVFEITTGKESFKWSPSGSLKEYNNVYTLDVSKQTLTPGKYPLRSALLISMRVLLTLLIEGFIFYLFGFREKRSWIVFFVVNLVTQGVLNVLLDGGEFHMAAYLVLVLVMVEAFVFGAEMIAFPLLLKEHSKKRIFTYVLIANFMSLIAGGYIISVLPV